MNYYISTVTGKVFNETDLNVIDEIYGDNTLSKVISDGFLKLIDPPSVVDLLNYNRFTLAAKRYMEIHNGATFKESIDAVRKIQKEMKQLRNKSK